VEVENLQVVALDQGEQLGQEPHHLVVAVVLAIQAIEIEVVDDGPGFPADILPRLGEPYVTSRPQGKARRALTAQIAASVAAAAPGRKGRKGAKAGPVPETIEAIGKICREKGVIFHVDAAQATGRVDIDLGKLPVDLMSLTSHKTYGPKGIGALYRRKRNPKVQLAAQIQGGGQQDGGRSGTLPTPLIVGLAEAIRLGLAELITENQIFSLP
jgi:hypothetical protein